MGVKPQLIMLLLAALVSCQHTIDRNLLPGVWTPKNETGTNKYSQILFIEPDSIVARTYDYGRLTSETGGKYRLDVATRILTASYGDSIIYDLEIKKLSNTELELNYLATGQSQLYIRQ